MLPNKISFIDLETTGINHERNRIIEIGIVQIENNKLIHEYSSLINPQTYLPPEITKITGLKEEDLEDAPLFQDIADGVLSLIEGSILAAHNVRFDYGFLKEEFEKIGLSFISKHFCTVKLSRSIFPDLSRHNLDTIIDHFGIKINNRHRALDDARVLWEFYKITKEKVGDEILEKKLDEIIRKPSLPLFVSQKSIDALPRTPGVYIFYGEENTPIYIGKSKNIKNRVLDHFSNDINDRKEMRISQQIKNIDFIQTAGELGALMLESKLIKEQLPIYNKKLRQSRKLIIVHKIADKNGYLSISANEMVPGEEIENLEDIIFVSKSKKQLRDHLFELAKKHKLCPKLLQLEKTSSACFYYRLNICLGACINKENSLKYNLRFLEAFSNSKILPWPFKQAIKISEHNSNGLREDIFIDKWCYLGSVKTDEYGSIKIHRSNSNFDLDTYKIISSFIKRQNSLLASAVPMSKEEIDKILDE